MSIILTTLLITCSLGERAKGTARPLEERGKEQSFLFHTKLKVNANVSIHSKLRTYTAQCGKIQSCNVPMQDVDKNLRNLKCNQGVA